MTPGLRATLTVIAWALVCALALFQTCVVASQAVLIAAGLGALWGYFIRPEALELPRGHVSTEGVQSAIRGHRADKDW